MFVYFRPLNVKPKILVIEDEALIRENLFLMLEDDYIVYLAKDGIKGIAAAFAMQPDLILCERKMPGIDGDGVLTALRRDSNTALIPLIFLTAKRRSFEQRQGMTLGADDYLIKPYKRTEVLEAIACRIERAPFVTS